MKTTQKTRTQKSVENGIKIVNTAIRKKVSLTKAAKLQGFGKNYVSDIKARITYNVKNKNIDSKTANTFKTLVKEYTSI